MPISTSQQRTSVGAYQNKLHDDFRKCRVATPSKNTNHTALSNEMKYMSCAINQAINSHVERYMTAPQNCLPQTGMATAMLILVSLAEFNSGPLSAKSNHQSCLSDREIPRPLYGDIGASDNSISNIILNPIMNVLYETEQFISRHDPLKFPSAEAASSPAVEEKSKEVLRNIKNSDDLLTDGYKQVKTRTKFLSNDLNQKTKNIIDKITNDHERLATEEAIDKLNHLVFTAEKKSPLDPNKYKNNDHLIHLINNNSLLPKTIKNRKTLEKYNQHTHLDTSSPPNNLTSGRYKNTQISLLEYANFHRIHDKRDRIDGCFSTPIVRSDLHPKRIQKDLFYAKNNTDPLYTLTKNRTTFPDLKNLV